MKQNKSINGSQSTGKPFSTRVPVTVTTMTSEIEFSRTLPSTVWVALGCVCAFVDWYMKTKDYSTWTSECLTSIKYYLMKVKRKFNSDVTKPPFNTHFSLIK